MKARGGRRGRADEFDRSRSEKDEEPKGVLNDTCGEIPCAGHEVSENNYHKTTIASFAGVETLSSRTRSAQELASDVSSSMARVFLFNS